MYWINGWEFNHLIVYFYEKFFLCVEIRCQNKKKHQQNEMIYKIEFVPCSRPKQIQYEKQPLNCSRDFFFTVEQTYRFTSLDIDIEIWVSQEMQAQKYLRHRFWLRVFFVGLTLKQHETKKPQWRRIEYVVLW